MYEVTVFVKFEIRFFRKFRVCARDPPVETIETGLQHRYGTLADSSDSEEDEPVVKVLFDTIRLRVCTNFSGRLFVLAANELVGVVAILI